jgi:hypothetical protein
LDGLQDNPEKLCGSFRVLTVPTSNRDGGKIVELHFMDSKSLVYAGT